jgi:hypothetical protein
MHLCGMLCAPFELMTSTDAATLPAEAARVTYATGRVAAITRSFTIWLTIIIR